jgi:hypothetical protein
MARLRHGPAADQQQALNDPQTEVAGHRVEVAILMQEKMISFHAKCPDYHVDRFAHRYSMAP